MVEVEQGARHHRQDQWTQSREYVVLGYLITHCMLFLPSYSLYTVPVEARRNLSARGNNTQIRCAMCGRMRYKREFGKVGIDWHVKIIN